MIQIFKAELITEFIWFGEQQLGTNQPGCPGDIENEI